MAEYNLGASGGSFEDYVARAQAAARAAEELNQKERQRQQAEERTGTIEQQNVGVRRGVAGATDQLSAALQRNLNLLVSETEAVAANTAAWRANLAAKLEAATGGRAASTAAAAPVVTPAATMARAAEQEAAYAAEAAAMQAAAAQRAAQAVSGRAPLMLPPGRSIYAGPASGGAAATEPMPMGYGSARWRPPTLMGGPSEAVAAGSQEESAVRTLATRNAAAVGELGAVQRSTNLAFNESAAAYAASSQALSRHGALTTEFISAFARGQVTMKEFESQMLSTMGKFGGWVVAGAAIYGAFETVKHVLAGATETQTGIQQVGRFIDLSGPRQQERAAQSFRDISVQFNVPIKEVVDSMQVMARVFHNISDAGDATRAVLAAVKLDMVPREQAEQYVQGIAQTMGWVVNGQGGGPETLGLINSLNQLQKEFGARVSQTLPAVARAAPAALASGTDPATLAALAAMGVTSGLPGNQVGTALLRSMGTFAFRPQSEATFRQFGIQAQPGDYRGLIDQIVKVLDRQGPDRLQGTQVRELAQALGGPLLGTRTLLPMLYREYQHPGMIEQYTQAAAHPGSFQEDLSRVLGTTGERFHSLGIALEQFGSLLSSSGVLAPLLAGFDILSTVMHGLTTLVTPLAHLISYFNALPEGLRDVLGALLAFTALRSVYNTQFGSNVQGFVGRLPGLGAIDSDPRAAIRGTLGRMQTFQLPAARADEERLDRQYMQARQAQVNAVNASVRAQAEAEAAGVTVLPTSDPRRAAYEEQMQGLRADLANKTRAADAAEQKAVVGGEAVAQLQADIAVMKDGQYSTAQKTAYMEERGLVAMSATVDAQEAALVGARAMMEGMGVGGTAAAGSMAAGVGAMALVGGARGGTGSQEDVLTRAVARGSAVAQSEGGASLGAWRSAALMGTVGLTAATQKLSGIAERAGAFVTGPGLPFAGLMGTQLLGSAIGGGVGGGISTLGGAGFTGMMMAQMMGGGKYGGLAGLGLGLMLGGMQQGGSAGEAAGIGGGALSGAAIGTMIDPGLGTVVGGVIGAGVGFASSLLGGGGSKGPDKIPTGLTDKQSAQLRALQAGGSASAKQLDQYGENFSQALSDAFTKTGDAATNAQNTIQKQVGQMQATVKAFGFQSAAGRGALDVIAEQGVQAVQYLPTDPNAASQIIQQTQTAMQTVATQAQEFMKWGRPGPSLNLSRIDPAVAAGIANNPAYQGSTAMSGAMGSMNALMKRYEDARKTAVQQVSADLDALAQLRDKRDSYPEGTGGRTIMQGKVDAKRKETNDAIQAVQLLDSTIPQLQQMRKDLQEQLQAQNLSSQQQWTEQGAAMANTQTRNPVTQARNLMAARTTELQRARSAHGLSPTDYRSQLAAAEQQYYDAQTQYANAISQGIQSQGAVALAQIPTTDPVGRARESLQIAANVYRTLANNPAMRGSPELRAAMAAMLDAQNALADATYQNAVSMIQAEGQLAQAQAGGDAALQAAANAQQGSRMLGVARTPQERMAAQAQIISAQTQAQDAAMQTAQLQGQIAEAQAYGDDIAVANAAIAAANAQLAAAHTNDQRLQAQLALIQANQQLEQARLGRIKDLADLQASQTLDPVRQAYIEMQGAAKALAQTPASQTDLHIKAQTEYNTRRQAWEAAKIQSRQDDINFELQMQEITTQQAINQLTDLLHLKGLTKQQKHAIMEQIRSLQMSDSTGGQFDLAPGSIHLPTVYDVNKAIHDSIQSHVGARARSIGTAAHRAVSQLSTPGSPQGVHIDSRPVINVWVGSQKDLAGVADAIDRGIGSQLHARLRAAGIRGT